MMMVVGFAEHVGAFAVGIDPNGHVAFALQVLERSVHRRERHLGLRLRKRAVNFRGRKKAALATENFSDQLARTGDVVGSDAHAKTI